MIQIIVLLAVCVIAGPACKQAAEEVTPRVFLVDQVPVVSGTFARGDLLDLRQQGGLSTSVTLSGETRRALTPSLPARLTFAVDLPAEPSLRFAIGVATLGKPNERNLVEFKMTLNAGDGERICFKETVARAQRNQWLDRRIDLSRWSGSKVRIHLEVGPGVSTGSSVGEEATLFPLWGNPVIAGAAGGVESPNLILISVDCLRPDHMGLYGHSNETTPYIDAFSRQAVVFDNAVSTSSWTLPTHMSMMTGLTPSFHGAGRSEKLAGSQSYLPELLSKAGYETLGVVTGAYLSQSFGFERGFHIYRTMAHPRAGKAVDEALQLLRRSSGRGFFLFLHLFDPHWKYLPPEEFVDRFGSRPADIDRLLAIVLNREPPGKPTDVEQLMNLYDGEIAYLDREVGRFFEALEQMEIFESSLIILTADHGEAFYEHGYWQHSDVLYEETIRIPLIVKWPGNALKGRVGQPVSLIDIFPTLMKGAGLPHEKTMGASLDGFRPGDEGTARRRTISETVWSSPDNRRMKVALRSDDLKYIATFATGDDNLTIEEMVKEELYNLVSDPGEKRSLDDADHLESFRRELRSYLEEAGAYLARSRKGKAVELDDEVAERLRSLGYIK